MPSTRPTTRPGTTRPGTSPAISCRINRCTLAACWTVTIAGHPNVRGVQVSHYCTEHARQKAATLWEESPVVYRITVEGPWTR